MTEETAWLFPDEALPCPECGSEPAWHRRGEAFDVHCTNTACRRYSDAEEGATLEEAARAWNARARSGEEDQR